MSNKEKFPFQKINYIIMIAGVLVLCLGFIIMTLDTEPYGFGFAGLTLGPLTVLAGFIIEFFAIFYQPKESK
ncbi:DUF3098 domain-containing protein [Imperialibacter roseus]|jgi:hypothetical protein|uniref:DUF3098 domain-containing protein n=1 Tax=Imperialibacter roseus TaxID=1324217 RepID=A0ABZ0IZD7_9BACT|nr:DUF3098 domain-containing protein [Imperialibacter roseus]WOK09713.1 DUF3098 domain-containing protein [Imperialibacter roseus]|tara:strand:+ start:12706 stop:12921 length:216 start_codon:yes stop_codon:yes gene_type:complete